MFNKMLLSALCLSILTVFPCQAEDGLSSMDQSFLLGLKVDVSGRDSEFLNPENDSGFYFEESRGLAYELAGNKREGGALRFFMIDQSFSKQADEGLLAEGLNQISPAAGLQFTMDFSL